MDVLLPAINTLIIEPLTVRIKKHIGFLVSARKHVKDMDDRMKILELRASDVNKKKEENDVTRRRIPAHVPNWLSQVEKVKIDVEGVAIGGGNVCFNMKMRYKAGKRSSDILKEIDRLIKEENEIKWNDEEIPLGRIGSNNPSTSASPAPASLDHGDSSTQNCFKSRQMIFEQALKSLDPNNNTQKIALCGMGGVGKTTMMEQLKKHVENRKMFDWVVKAVIGQNPNTIEVQQAIADYMGGSLNEKDKGARADRFHERFGEIIKSGKKILVILDDLWKEFDLKDIGLASPLPNGIMLLLTSRFDNVCTQMGVKPNSIFKVGVLNDEEAKTLFFQIVELSEHADADADLHKIGQDIAKKCGGLPIAIKTVASSLKDNIKEAWKVALSRLESHDLEDLDTIVKDVFWLTYDNLKNDDDKAIFLLSGLFPDDFDIPVEDLMRYGWGLKLFKKVYNIAQARERTNDCVNKLKRANLLTESDIPGCVKMHDLMREFVLSNFTKVKQASVVNHDNKSEWPTEDTRESCERILIDCRGMSEFPVNFNHPNLTFLMLLNGNEKLKFPEDFYERMKKLEVIAYTWMKHPLLLRQFQCSTTLRSLCLYHCTRMIDFPCIENLVNLEVLSIAYCGIQYLPSTIGKLRKLRVLDLTGCNNLSIDDSVFQNLENLEELYMASTANTPRFTEANCNELKTLSTKLRALEMEFFKNKAQPENVSFENLERFRISIGCSLNLLYDKSLENTLRLVTNRNKLIECKINELFKSTEKLSLEVWDMDHIDDFSAHPSRQSFSNLRHLTVSKCENLTYLFTIPVASGLTKLEMLSISSCPVLKELILGESENSGGMVIKFQYLKHLTLKSLPKLISLCHNLIELPRLVNLSLDDLPNFTSIYNNDDIGSAMLPILKKEVKTPKLEILEIKHMEKLKQIWPCNEEVNISMLRKIEVYNCDSLVNLFPTNPMPLLSHIEELRVKECNSLEVLINIELECVGNLEQVSCRLRTIYAYGLEKLRAVWRIKGYVANNSITSFQALEKITIESCKMFRNTFTPKSTSNFFRMGALVDFTIKNCGESEREMNVISKEGEEINDNNVAFPSHLIHTFHHLRTLCLDNYEGMEVVFEITRNNQQQQLLPYLETLKLDNMEMISHVWKCWNWNEFLILQKPHPQSSFHNLTTITMWGCKSIKYLFSPLMAKLLSNLNKININSCDGMEEVVSNRDDDDEAILSSHTNTNFFPHLDTLHLVLLSNLKRIDGVTTSDVIHNQLKFSQASDVSWSLCQYSREISIYDCHALSSVVPSYALGQMQKLQVLKILYCRGMTEVFEKQGIENNISGGGGGSSTNIDEGNGDTSLAIPRLENLNLTQLSNLKELEIDRCERLQHVFTYSTLKSLRQLQVLKVKACNAMKVIVNEEQINSSSDVFVFPFLKSLKLVDLPDLKGFFLGTNNFQWPFLDEVLIANCPQIMVFTSGESTTPKLKYIHTSLGKHSFSCDVNFQATTTLDQALHTQLPSSESTSSFPANLECFPWSFHNLIEMDSKLMNRDVQKIFRSSELLQLQKLEKIHLLSLRLVEEVFEIVSVLEGSNINSGLQTVVEIPNLRHLIFMSLRSLKYIWKRSEFRVVEFPNLTKLSITACRALEHVFTRSMLDSVPQLQELLIISCENMKVVVKEEEEACDLNVKEIRLSCLKSMELVDLKSLKGFCLGKDAFSWPSLDDLYIEKCPAITVFTNGHLTTPKLKIIETRFRSYYLEEELNSFIKTKQQQGLNTRR